MANEGLKPTDPARNQRDRSCDTTGLRCKQATSLIICIQNFGAMTTYMVVLKTLLPHVGYAIGWLSAEQARALPRVL